MVDINWRAVKEIQRRSYEGSPPSQYEMGIVQEAHAADPEKYKTLHQEVIEEHWAGRGVVLKS